ncbi:MAG: fructose-1,6-bisphosphatase [Oscillospiraceae bacterium]|nr:fructose-1,6-bisphosphatase [Oscillospiraceae bacterium]
MQELNASNDLRYIKMLSRQYPTVKDVSTEIVNLSAILALPKGTEHFMSDIHAEYEAFLHILNNSSGVIKEKIDMLFSNSVSAKERASLATLIYYPKQKLEEVKKSCTDMRDWYTVTINRLLDVCRLVSSKYTRSKVRKALPKGFEYILDELLHATVGNNTNKEQYYENIISTIIDINQADEFIKSISKTIKRLTVDHLHIVGDIFDRGPRADKVLDLLMEHHSVDIQWGNHDILWMGAAAGSEACIMCVLKTSVNYNNLEVLETGYGINLRPLAIFANEVYGNSDCSAFNPKLNSSDNVTPKDITMAARMHKAVSIILFKLEGQIIDRHPEFGMEDRKLLHKIDYENKTLTIDGTVYDMRDCYLPTIDPADPYRLSEEEEELVRQLKTAFLLSEKLQSHARFLYAKGSIYTIYNSNLLLHACVPMNDDGSFREFTFNGKKYSGKALFDYADLTARQGYYSMPGSEEKIFGEDFIWFLWCGKYAPIFGKEKMTTFERCFIADKTAWNEPKDPYYKHIDNKNTCIRVLNEFGCFDEYSHIINGHIPVKYVQGENPVKAEGKLINIDGGFSRAYHKTTGIAGYTLIYNSVGMRLVAHEPFESAESCIQNNTDILSSVIISQRASNRMTVADTDAGAKLKADIEDLKMLLEAYVSGKISESR